ncbi:MAG: ABC transporter permease [Trueperaceae bacterium]
MTLLGYKLEPRTTPSAAFTFLITLGAIVVALIITGVLFAVFGVNPFAAYKEILEKTLFNLRGFSEVVRRMIPLLLCGVGIALALKARFWNIGAEGQLLAGAAAAAGLALFAPLPGVVMIPAMFLAGFVVAGLWGFLPAILKVRLGVNEIITTLMMNYIALYIVRALINGTWKGSGSRGFPETDKFAREFYLPTLPTTRLHYPTLILGIVLTLFIFFMLRQMKLGFDIRIMGESPDAARYAGINFFSTTMLLVLLSAGAAGLAGVGEVAGIHRKLLEPSSISLGYGYTGMIVALLARGNPLGTIPAALFLGLIFASGDVMKAGLGLPTQMVDVINGLVLICIICAEPLLRFRFVKQRKTLPLTLLPKRS